MTRTTYYSDRTKLEELPPLLASELRSRELISSFGEPKVSFCGVLIRKNEIDAFIPRGVPMDLLTEEEKTAFLGALMNALLRFARDSRTAANEAILRTDAKGLALLSLYRELLIDYLTNGLLSQRIRIKGMNYGRPDWGRTIKNSLPFVGHGGPVYLEIHTSNKVARKDFEIAQIHAEIIRDLSKCLYWLVSQSDFSWSDELVNIPKLEADCEQKIAILLSRLNTAYSDREIRLIKLMVQYLTGKAEGGETAQIFGVTKFHFAWEHMLRSTLPNVVDLSKDFPIPTYRFGSSAVLKAPQKGMRVDIFLSSPSTRNLAVVDAKYYAATQINNAPGWHDMVKQYFYARTLRSIYPKAIIHNVFIFPGCSSYISEIAMAEASPFIGTDILEEFPPIKCFYINPATVIDAYNSNSMINVNILTAKTLD